MCSERKFYRYIYSVVYLFLFCVFLYCCFLFVSVNLAFVIVRFFFSGREVSPSIVWLFLTSPRCCLTLDHFYISPFFYSSNNTFNLFIIIHDDNFKGMSFHTTLNFDRVGGKRFLFNDINSEIKVLYELIFIQIIRLRRFFVRAEKKSYIFFWENVKSMYNNWKRKVKLKI